MLLAKPYNARMVQSVNFNAIVNVQQVCITFKRSNMFIISIERLRKEEKN